MATGCRSGTKPNATYLDPETGEVLPTWDQALDAITDTSTSRCTSQGRRGFDAQGVLAGSKDAQPVHRLPDQVPDQAPRPTATSSAPMRRPRTPPGSPRRCAGNPARRPARTGCATGSSPRMPGRGLRPGACKGKAHRREYLGYAGRRVLTSRKWSGKTLADHRADRKNWLTDTLGLRATDPGPLHLAAGRARRPGPACPPGNGCCTSSPTGCTGSRPSTRPADEPRDYPTIFRQPGGQHDWRSSDNHG